MSTWYSTRPLSDRTWLRPAARREGSRFEASWSKTLVLLQRELGLLEAKNVVLEVDIPPEKFRLDGTPRSDARASSPAVVVAFESKHGPQLYRCDRYVAKWSNVGGDDWQHNVRAVALTLEALRSVDRYGATETGQQYTGFRALGAGTAMPASHMTSDEAWSIIGSYQPDPIATFRAQATDESKRAAYRRAQAANHPDRRGGDQTLWDQVERAGAVLGLRR